MPGLKIQYGQSSVVKGDWGSTHSQSHLNSTHQCWALTAPDTSLCENIMQNRTFCVEHESFDSFSSKTIKHNNFKELMTTSAGKAGWGELYPAVKKPSRFIALHAEHQKQQDRLQGMRDKKNSRSDALLRSNGSLRAVAACAETPRGAAWAQQPVKMQAWATAASTAGGTSGRADMRNHSHARPDLMLTGPQCRTQCRAGGASNMHAMQDNIAEQVEGLSGGKASAARGLLRQLSQTVEQSRRGRRALPRARPGATGAPVGAGAGVGVAAGAGAGAGVGLGAGLPAPSSPIKVPKQRRDRDSRARGMGSSRIAAREGPGFFAPSPAAMRLLLDTKVL